MSSSGDAYSADHDELAESPAPSGADLSVSHVPLPSAPSPPTVSPASAARERFRSEMQSTVQSMLSSGAALGAVRTYEAVHQAMVPRIVEKLGSLVLPMRGGAAFLAFPSTLVMFGPKSPAESTAHPSVRWSYAKLVKAAAAFWLAARGSGAVSDELWYPRMGVFWAGIKCSRVHHAVERAPPLLADWSVVRGGFGPLAARRGGWRLSARGVRPGLPAGWCGFVASRCVHVHRLFFGVRRPSEVAQLVGDGVCGNSTDGVVDLDAKCQKNDQFFWSRGWSNLVRYSGGRHVRYSSRRYGCDCVRG